MEGKDKMMGFRVVYARVMGGILEEWPRYGLGSVVWACHQVMEDLVEFRIACSAVQGLTGFMAIATVVECGILQKMERGRGFERVDEAVYINNSSARHQNSICKAIPLMLNSFPRPVFSSEARVNIC